MITSEPSDLPIGAYILTVSLRGCGEERYMVEADGYQQAAERAAEWCSVDDHRGTLHVITGDDSSRQIARIDGADWRLL